MKHSANWTWTGVNWHPHAQRIWIDDLRIFTVDARSSAVESDNWGSVKREIKKGSE